MSKANVLVIGSGGREHALCWRLMQSPGVAKVFCAPGNGGIGEDVSCVELKSPGDIVAFCKKESIALVVIGPEQPLVEGLADRLTAEGIPVFGPSAAAARLEGSKGFMKDLCRKYGIPTAAYGFFADAATAKKFLEDKTFPIVVKADGLAAGKGVIIAQDKKEAEDTIDNMFAGSFGDSGKSVVIEEFLEGEEVSFFALCDGETAIEFGYAQDHKRAFDNDQGPNTGGMGAYAPPPVMNETMSRTVMEKIVLPTVAAIKKEGSPFKGVLFAGLMLTKDGPKLIEYNVRFGDPETQVLMMLFQGDLFPILMASAKGCLPSTLPFPAGGEGNYGNAAVCVVMAANGYPGAYEKGSVIRGLEKAGAASGVKIFHAGTQKRGDDIVANGGRVLGVTALGHSIAEAKEKAYHAVNAIHWPEGFCRRDIAWRALTKAS